MHRLSDSPFAESDKVSEWIALAKAGDPSAADRLWKACFGLLIRFAHRKLLLSNLRVADEEDVALSAFFALWQGLTQQKFSKLNNRHELWKLLWKIALYKAISHYRAYSREPRMGQQLEFDVAELASFEGRDVLPGVDELRDCVPKDLQNIALRLLTGASDEEIAAEAKMSLRTLQRRYVVIERAWRNYLAPDHA